MVFDFLWLIGIGGFSAMLLAYALYRSGMSAQKLKEEQRKNEVSFKAQRIRERLRDDGAFVKRLRARFRR
jgi:hypothetical protein